MGAEVDAKDGRQSFDQPLTPGLAFTTASGLAYLPPSAAAVPEPGTWLLLATGGVGLLGYAWRHRQRTA